MQCFGANFLGDREEALATVVARSASAARDIDVALSRAERVLEFMATRRELQNLDGERCSELVKGLTSMDPLLANVGAVDLGYAPAQLQGRGLVQGSADA